MSVDEVHEACAQLRFAEGLRRRWEEARAESAIREACGLALLAGARVSPTQLRAVVVTGRQDGRLGPDLAVALGAWKATWTIVSGLPPLNVRSGRGPAKSSGLSLRQSLAGMQRDYGGYLAEVGLADPAQLTIPRDPTQWGQLLAGLEGDTQPALTLAGRAWAALTVLEPFEVGSELMGILTAKLVLAQRGVEPTAVSVLTALAVEQRARYQLALAEIRAGESAEWDQFVADAVVRGCEVGQQVAREVQAGRLAP